MKIAIIGIGNVGGTLGPAWAKAGHDVIFGVRDPNSEKVKTVLENTGQKARVAGVAEAALAAEIVVFATPWSATQDAVQAAGNLEGKLVVDCTNPIAPDLKGLVIGTTTSAAEQVAQWAKGARVVKAFNTTGSGNMSNPLYGSQPLTIFICGDDPEAREMVARLAEDLGFEPFIAGPLYHARYFEPMAMLWVDMAYLQGRGPEFAYKIRSH
jgi:NADPH-dependent F420 reductase